MGLPDATGIRQVGLRIHEATPNGWKPSCTLEELGMSYQVHPVDIMKTQHRAPTYVKLNPNSKIPTIVDHDAKDFAVFESGGPS